MEGKWWVSVPLEEPVTAEYVEELRASITELVTLDGQQGGTGLAPLAERMFRAAAGKWATGKCPANLEADFAATVAELGEVAGWLAFDAAQHDRVAWLNRAALHFARYAGDAGMELFVLGNMALHEQETGRSREAMRTVRRMEEFRLSPRLRVLVALRRARATADLGDERSIALIRRAQAGVDDGVRRTDPQWAWWVDSRELQVHEGAVLRALGHPGRAVDCYAAAWQGVPSSYRWAAYIGGASLVSVLIDVRSWAEAERVAEDVAGLASEVSSARTAVRLREAAVTARRLGAPSRLVGMVATLGAEQAV